MFSANDFDKILPKREIDAINKFKYLSFGRDTRTGNESIKLIVMQTD